MGNAVVVCHLKPLPQLVICSRSPRSVLKHSKSEHDCLPLQEVFHISYPMDNKPICRAHRCA